MEWNIYKEWLDINLYRQMVSMIYQSSSREDKMNFMRKEKENDLFYGAYKQSLEEEYGLYYPGEVLERIKEHRSMTKPVYRALGLALAKSDYLQEKCMFNGTQKLDACFRKKTGNPGSMSYMHIHTKRWRK